MTKAMQYSLIRWVIFANAFYVFALLLRQVYMVDTISHILIGSQFMLVIIILFGLNTLRFKREELLLLLLVGVAFLKSDFDNYQINNITIDFLKPVLFIFTVAAIRSAAMTTVLTDERLGRIFLLYAITTGVSVSIGIYYDAFVASIYPAYSSIYSLMGYFYLIRQSRYSALSFLLLLALSGKRAVMLSGLLAQINVRSLLKRLPSLLPLVVFSCVLGVIFSYQIGWDWLMDNMLKVDPSVIDGAIDNFEILLYITGGRMDELIDGLSYDFTPVNILFGKSLGYTYVSLAFEEANHRNFHFTPASLFVHYGAIFTMAFAIYIFKIVFDKKTILLAGEFDNLYVIRMYLIGSLFFFLTEYGVFGYINFCIGLGLLAGAKSSAN
jgi:hypothetical protein